MEGVEGDSKGGSGGVTGARRPAGRGGSRRGVPESPFGSSTFENSESHLKFAPRVRRVTSLALSLLSLSVSFTLPHFPCPRTVLHHRDILFPVRVPVLPLPSPSGSSVCDPTPTSSIAKSCLRLQQGNRKKRGGGERE